MLGTVIGHVLVDGLRLIEAAAPMPRRLGTALAPAQRARADADPVVLVCGFANSASGFDEWRRSLEADGFRVFVFESSTRGLGDLRDSAAQLAAFLADVRRRTGRARLDIVGFSEGGLLARMVVGAGRFAGRVDRLISLATPHAGINAWSAYTALAGWHALRDAAPPAILQLLTGSELLQQIERDDRELRLAPHAGGPRYASVHAWRSDLLVAPWSAQLAGALDIPIRADSSLRIAPTHYDMLHTSDRAYEAARRLLLDGANAEVAAVAAGWGATD